MKMNKKFMSVALAAVMALGCMGSAFALDASNQHDVVDGNGTSEVKVTAEAIQMTVTVPVVLPASFDNEGNATVATNAKIINKSYAPVKVSQETGLTAATGWTAKATDYDFAKDKLGTKNFAFSLKGVANDGTKADLGEAPVLDGINDTDSDEYAFTYDVKISGQREALTDVKVADVVFTVDWAA